jgi:hypothetical protein
MTYRSMLVAALASLLAGCNPPINTCGLTPAQVNAITADLVTIKGIGFTKVRLITYNKAGDPALAGWPSNVFLTFPVPTSHEVDNLKEFFALANLLGITHEVVLLMPDSSGLYYEHGVTDADYRAFVDALMPALSVGGLDKVYVGGDLMLGSAAPDQAKVANHRRWVNSMWPYVVAKCPSCKLGLELFTSYAYFWDLGADSTAWIRANLARQPDYLGYQFYPTTHAALIAGGFETGGVVNWAAVTRDWLTHLQAVAGPIPVAADELGLMVGNDFTAADQSAFLTAAYGVFNAAGVPATVWEFADHPGIGDIGLFTTTRAPRPAVAALPAALAGAVTPGLQYTPPEAVGFQWLMPAAGAPACAP